MNLLYFSLCFSLCITALGQQNAVKECLTPKQERGSCIPQDNCKYFDWRNRTVIYAEEFQLLISSLCDNINNIQHICCPEMHSTYTRKEVIERLQHLDCGRVDIFRIANGQQAPLFAFPWMALLKYNTGKVFRCGGTLIDERHVLTAAHCVKGFENILTQVRLGEHNISSSSDCNRWLCAPPVEDVYIEKIILPTEKRSALYDDIALLRLNRTITFQRHIKPICLPITPELVGGKHEEFIVTGWGRTETNESSDVLMMATVPHRHKSLCEMAFHINGLNESHICAGGEELTDSCRGDSGGPIAAFDRYNSKLRLVQFGIVSLGARSCGQITVPAIYTNVSNYMNWIIDKLAK